MTGKRKTQVQRDYDYSVPLAGKVVKEAPEQEDILEKKQLVRDWSEIGRKWRMRIMPGPPIFYIMFIVAMIIAWLRIPH